MEPARAFAAETLALERAMSDFVNQAYGLKQPPGQVGAALPVAGI
jgi:hypothetical protein